MAPFCNAYKTGPHKSDPFKGGKGPETSNAGISEVPDTIAMFGIRNHSGTGVNIGTFQSSTYRPTVR